MHLKRWITAILALPVLILLVYKGPPFLFFLLISMVSILALREFFTIVFTMPDDQGIRFISGVGFISGCSLILTAYLDATELLLGILAVNLIVSSLIAFFMIKTPADGSKILMKQAVGILYVPLLLSFLILIRNGMHGIGWLFYLLAVVFTGDTFAFYGGTYLGRLKLAPLISPGKTIEGSMSGLLANVGVGLLFHHLMTLPMSKTACVLLSICLGVAGQIGDLFESLMKRAANIKDSGGILPGHGGMLDRIDAVLFAAPVLYLYIQYLTKS